MVTFYSRPHLSQKLRLTILGRGRARTPLTANQASGGERRPRYRCGGNERYGPPFTAPSPTTACRPGLDLASEWKQIIGPAAIISSPLTPETNVSFTAPGIYGFQLSDQRRSGAPRRRGGGSRGDVHGSADARRPDGMVAGKTGRQSVVSGIHGARPAISAHGTGKVGGAFSVAARRLDGSGRPGGNGLWRPSRTVSPLSSG